MECDEKIARRSHLGGARSLDIMREAASRSRGAVPRGVEYPAVSGGGVGGVVGMASTTRTAAAGALSSLSTFSSKKMKLAATLVLVMLSATCCRVSSQGHVQETIGQTLQGE